MIRASCGSQRPSYRAIEAEQFRLLQIQLPVYACVSWCSVGREILASLGDMGLRHLPLSQRSIQQELEAQESNFLSKECDLSHLSVPGRRYKDPKTPQMVINR